MKYNQPKITMAMGALLLSSLATASAQAATFTATELATGYQVTAPEGSCGGTKKADDKTTTADDKSKEGKCGEGKCGEGKCGEGKCGAEPAKTTTEKSKEGKCGEGKCGEGKCGGLN